LKRRALLLAILGTLALGCGSQASAPSITSPQPGNAPQFAFTGLDGARLTPASVAGRTTVIGFLTTYDVHSQAEARFLAMLERHHTPRINVIGLILEAPENQPLVEAFVTSLGLRYPIALADAETIAGDGPFAGLHHVPSVVILDRDGREAWRHIGFVNEVGLEAAVRAVEQSSPLGRGVPQEADR
jgi:hypothetical protein